MEWAKLPVHQQKSLTPYLFLLQRGALPYIMSPLAPSSTVRLPAPPTCPVGCSCTISSASCFSDTEKGDLLIMLKWKMSPMARLGSAWTQTSGRDVSNITGQVSKVGFVRETSIHLRSSESRTKFLGNFCATTSVKASHFVRAKTLKAGEVALPSILTAEVSCFPEESTFNSFALSMGAKKTKLAVSLIQDSGIFSW